MFQSSITCQQIQRLYDLYENDRDSVKNYIIQFGYTDQLILKDLVEYLDGKHSRTMNLPFDMTVECELEKKIQTDGIDGVL